jgi:broad specificity phosphatase PhoE
MEFPKKRIFFIRHGQSINNVLEYENPSTYFQTRQKDPDLSEEGVRQCLDLKNRIQSLDIEKGRKYTVITSPMLRCLKTTQIVFADRQVPIEVRPEFYEQGGMWNLYEVFTGIGKQEILGNFPGFDASKIQDEGYFFLDHMETIPECEERVKTILNILKDYTESSIAVVVHGLLMERIAKEVISRQNTNRTFYLALRPNQRNCGVTLVEYSNSAYILQYEFSLDPIS